MYLFFYYMLVFVFGTVVTINHIFRAVSVGFVFSDGVKRPNIWPLKAVQPALGRKLICGARECAALLKRKFVPSLQRIIYEWWSPMGPIEFFLLKIQVLMRRLNTSEPKPLGYNCGLIDYKAFLEKVSYLFSRKK